MPKLKTHRGAKKRFKLTGTSKVRAGRAGSNHMLTKKSISSKRKKRNLISLGKADSALVKKLVPNL